MFGRFALLAFGAAIVDGYANPGACSGTCVNTHDPSVLQGPDGTWFRFSTGGHIPIHTAPAIEGPWTYACDVLSTDAVLKVGTNQGTDCWAPDVSLVGSSFHVYYTVSSFGTQNSAIGLATSPAMQCGTFTDQGGIGIASTSAKPYNAIDANLFNDGGTWRMTFGSFWGGLYQAVMNTDATSPTGGSVQIAYEPAGNHPIEGGYLIKNGNYYYLFFSWGICCGFDTTRPAAGQEYRIKVCRSERADGGFYDAAGLDCIADAGAGTVVLESHDNVYGPGGQSLYFDGSRNAWIIVYHYVDITIGYADGQKQFGWNVVDFSTEWPVV